MAKVSVVIPVYNMEKYLRQCLDSVAGQTLKDLEIICVNDGSTDGSMAIMDEYAAKDSRFIIIDKPNGGYGHSMNCGFDKATGEYIGIVESDDYADPEMFEDLYREAKRYSLDVIKSGFYYYWSVPEEKNIEEKVASKIMCSRVFCPATDFRSRLEQAEFFNIKPTIWSAIYRKDFIRENQIRFNETPGASFQDSSFNFKVMALAKRLKLTEKCYLHYRQDNEASSINSPGKVFCVCDEYQEMERFLNEHPELKGKLDKIRARIKYDSYIWNYERLAEPLQRQFLKRASKEFREDMKQGLFDKELFPFYKWESLMAITMVPAEYHKKRLAEKKGRRYDIRWPEGVRPKRTVFGMILAGFVCLKEHGVVYTVRRIKVKLGRR